MTDNEKEFEETANETAEAPDEEVSEEAQAETEAETEAVETPAAEAIDYYDKWLRVTAEYQNYRTRTQKEKEEIYQNANAKFIGELLEVVDNFERAMDAKVDGDKFDEGIELIYKQFLAILDKNHVKEIECEGQPFDPVCHMAVQMMEVEGMESDLVAKVIKKGYKLNDKVIRPAMVVVSQ